MTKDKGKKKFVSDVHEPFAEASGTKLNYLYNDKKFGQGFLFKRGNFEWELTLSPSGRKASVRRIL